MTNTTSSRQGRARVQGQVAGPIAGSLLLGAWALASAAAAAPGQPTGPVPPAGTSGPLRVVIALDDSASMRANDPQGLVKAAVRGLVQDLGNDDEAALVVFDKGARLVQPLRRMGESGAREALLSSVDGVTFDGRLTDIPAGIERGVYELSRQATPGRASILVVTDGIVDVGSAAADAERTKWLRTDLLPDAAAKGVRIVGVAFTEQADYELLQSMARATGGAYYRALGKSDVAGIFGQVREAIAKRAPEPAKVASVTAPATITAPVTASAPGATSPSHATAPEQERTSWLGTSGLLLLVGILGALLAAVAWMVLRREARSGARSGVTGESSQVDAGPTMQAEGDESTVTALIQDIASGDRHRLEKRITTFGRRADSDVVVDEKTVSGQHAQIVRRRGFFYLVDLRSTNGTFLNDKRVEGEVLLRAGDVLRLDCRAYRYEGEVAPTQDHWPTGEGTVMRMTMPEGDPPPAEPAAKPDGKPSNDRSWPRG
jgi:hypothetical protein